MPLERIISGGQTGSIVAPSMRRLTPISHAAARALRNAPRRTVRFPRGIRVTPLPEGGYRERTLQNVLDSDGTVVIFAACWAAVRA